MKLLHYGLQRSGTNFLETVLNQNYNVHFLNSNKDRNSPIQKHFRLYDKKNMIPEPEYKNDIIVNNFDEFEALFKVRPQYYLVISKDPYSWYLSYKKWAKKCNWPKVNYHYIEEYNLFYGKFLHFSSQTEKLIFIKYIDLLKDTSTVLNDLEIKMKLKKKLMTKLRLKLPNQVSQSSNFTNEKKDYYINEKYLKEYNSEDLQTLNNLLDFQVVSSLGYEKKVVLQ